MTTIDATESSPGLTKDAAPPLPPPAARPRTSAMASLAQWEERGKGPSGTTVVSVVFSVGAIALGVLLVKSGVLAPSALTELDDSGVRHSWAPFFDVSAVGTASVNAAQPVTSLSRAPAPAAAEPRGEMPASAPVPATTPAVRETSPAPQVAAPAKAATAVSRAPVTRPAAPAAKKLSDDPFAHLEEGAATTPAPQQAPAPAPVVTTSPRIHVGKTTAVAAPPAEAAPAPTLPPTDGVPPSNHGKSTWGGERTPSP